MLPTDEIHPVVNCLVLKSLVCLVILKSIILYIFLIIYTLPFQKPEWAEKSVKKLQKARENAIKKINKERLLNVDKAEPRSSTGKKIETMSGHTEAKPDSANYDESVVAAAALNYKGLTEEDMEFAQVLLLEVSHSCFSN